jgi:hypothetical protein
MAGVRWPGRFDHNSARSGTGLRITECGAALITSMMYSPFAAFGATI